jgi:hypothetical protein
VAARRARADGFLLFIVTAISQCASTGCSMVIGRMVQARVCCTAWATWTASLLAYRKKAPGGEPGAFCFCQIVANRVQYGQITGLTLPRCSLPQAESETSLDSLAEVVLRPVRGL